MVKINCIILLVLIFNYLIHFEIQVQLTQARQSCNFEPYVTQFRVIIKTDQDRVVVILNNM